MNLDDARTPNERAAQARVVVIGGGIAGLVAALECAKVGMRVTLVEASAVLGGTIRGAELAGHTLDVGTQGFQARDGMVRELVDELGLGDEVVAPLAGTAWVAGLPGGAVAPMPAGGVLGIPANPFAAEVMRVVGSGGSWRAYVDRIRPVLTIGREHNLGRLVRSRMGAKVLDRLVAPVTRGVYGVNPDDIDVDLAAPGLNTGLTRTGSLSGAVAQMQGDDEAREAHVMGIRGGMLRLVAALEARLADLSVDVRVGVAAAGLLAPARAGGMWQVELVAVAEDSDDADDDTVRAGEEVVPNAPLEALAPLDADFVIVAVPEVVARGLLADELALGNAEVEAGQGTAEATESPIEVVTLVLDAAALDAAPHGPEVFAVAGATRATALIHETAKWPWLAEQLAADVAHRHVVRVTFGMVGEAPATAGLDLAGATAMAVAEASTMLGVPLTTQQVVASDRAIFSQARPAATIGHREQSAAVRAALARTPGVIAVGAWLAGSGLAQVIPDARAQAETVRQAALWGGNDAV
ncbi:MAG TPA: FAD-dependent oxidoreductase [Microbacteriaceae bacterium]|jgi:oxygen-dependent protoporphyrinogen oxidase|nr:FAD-dependent oxidoreductase [Microbacteriaceae bacterium]HQX35515.1 FAD-dependent oxidoreductase [Microbacteriaceae bacterium]HQZ47109.1 FAD-dependent oxidoreductase [Microbacteriaceae bacterium]HRA08009.1 FAD-dependent oxidoreductase [Microbacteriaceae bacterium]